MELQQYESELFSHLQDEFGGDGCRSVEFLLSAKGLLSSDFQSVSCRCGELVVFCLREAMTAIPASAGISGRGEWKNVSRAVVKAKKKCETALEQSDEECKSALLDDLFSKIGRLEEFHTQGRVHERGLEAVLVRRTGSVPLNPIVGIYQKLIGELNSGAHGNVLVSEARKLWDRCLKILHSLFLPPRMRHAELERLAQIDRPSDADFEAVRKHVVTPNHYRYFFTKVRNPVWLSLLDESWILDPGNVQTFWPVSAAVKSLARGYPEEVASWLAEMYEKYEGKHVVTASYLARIALEANKPVLDVVLRAVKEYPTNPGIVYLGVRAVEKIDPSDKLVQDFADVLLNEGSWKARFSIESLQKQFIDGINKENAVARLECLCYKLGSVPGEDWKRWAFEWGQIGRAHV